MPLQKVQDKAFFLRPPTEVAQDLLGKIICRKMEDDFVMRCRITETEAYFGEEPICYGFGAKKEAGKTEAFYSVGKVCFYCGMLMISCFRQRAPDNVLVRSVDCYCGPMRVTDVMDINAALHGTNVMTSDLIWLEDDGSKTEFISSKRVNISDDKPYRFSVKTILFNDGNPKPASL